MVFIINSTHSGLMENTNPETTTAMAFLHTDRTLLYQKITNWGDFPLREKQTKRERKGGEVRKEVGERMNTGKKKRKKGLIDSKGERREKEG